MFLLSSRTFLLGLLLYMVYVQFSDLYSIIENRAILSFLTFTILVKPIQFARIITSI